MDFVPGPKVDGVFSIWYGKGPGVDRSGDPLKHINYNSRGKKIFILGAGGVVSSIILALKKAGASEIVLSNRTKEKAENLKKKYSYLKVVDWGDIPDSNMIINDTSLGLKKDD